jgi:hypothetical protein
MRKERGKRRRERRRIKDEDNVETSFIYQTSKWIVSDFGTMMPQATQLDFSEYQQLIPVVPLTLCFRVLWCQRRYCGSIPHWDSCTHCL